MFYSHEVLTSRKYGFATVWLVATMGSSSKKVSRKAILDVDISKTCETIAAPAVPLALRLQSSLLYGVVKIYSQQCNYVLNDAESIRNQLRQSSRLLQTNGLIAEGANTGRADNLILGDDPAFLPELDLRLIDLDAPLHIEQFSNLALTNSLPVPTPRSASTSFSLGADLVLGTPLRPGQIPRLSDITNITAAAKRQTPQYEGLQDDLGIDFDFDGDARMQDTPTKPTSAPPVLPPDEPLYGSVLQVEDDYTMPEQQGRSSPLPSMVGNNENYRPSEPRATSESAQVNLHQKRKRTVPLDASTEIRSHIIKSLQENYVSNMEHDRRRKIVATSINISRDNALHWFLDTLQGDADSLNIFRGLNLVSSITDINLVTPKPTPFARESVERASLPALPADDDIGYVPDYNDVEVGREQPTPLDDHRQSTLLPWNLSSGLRRGGSQAAGSTTFDRRSRLPSLQPRSQLSFGGQSNHGDPQSIQDQVDYNIVEDVPIQLATESQWLRSALHDESMNFMTFVEGAVQQQGGKTAGIDFNILLPPLEHITMTVAQAFLHLLTLGTKNKLKAVQTEAFGPITISLS